MKISKVLLVVPLILFHLCIGCQYDPHVSDFTTLQPTQSIVGIYLPTAETSNFIDKQHYSSPSSYIELSADGTFVFNHVPDIWNTSSGDAKGQFDTGSGQWLVEPYQDWWGVTLHFDNTQNFNSEHYKGGFITKVDLIGESRPYTLNLTIGDPDSGKSLQYRQQ